MDANGEVCLGLGLGLPDHFSSEKRDIHVPLPQNKNKNKNKRLLFLDLSITSTDHHHAKQESMSNFLSKEDDQDHINYSMNFGRKKLRLSRDQTTLLEDSFRQHTTLNLAQKQTLAARLNLKPRQVEVWFQNRRARTKLKQTEVEYEMLKKNCERLSEENRRLKKEVLELRSSMEKQPQAGTGRGGGEREEATAEVVHHP